VIFALAFIPASFLVFLIDERVTTSKHLQFVSGVKGLTYLWANFVWDLMNYCVSITFCIIIFLAFGIEAYVYKMNFLCLVLLLFLYGFAIIPLMYPINYFFKTPSTGFVLISCINIFIGLITTITTITLETFSDAADLQSVNDILTKVFLIFPHYCLGRGLFDMSKVHAMNIIYDKYGEYFFYLRLFFLMIYFVVVGYVAKSPFGFDYVGRNLLALSVEGVVFSILAILVQYRFFIPDR
jgi:ATP-binding cassette subfamily A (ABC1) protein 1